MKTSAQLQDYGLGRLRDPSVRRIIGVDEVGYGAWAGPVVVCATIVDATWLDPRVKDSKVVTAAKREQLVRDVLRPPNVLAYYILEHDNRAIDAMGLARARDDLVVKAVGKCLKNDPTAQVVMDGNQLPPGLPPRTLCFPKADSLVTAVSAASILAKVHRDTLMQSMHEEYPWYDFSSNVGYGSKRHEEGIAEHGLCAIHRFSYRNIRQVLVKERRMKLFLARLRSWRP